MANEKAIYRRNGDKLHYTATAAVAPGDVIKVGGIVGVAEAGGAAGELIALTVKGVFELATDGKAITQGALVYLDANGKATATAGDILLGTAWDAAAAGDGATVYVALNMGAASGGGSSPTTKTMEVVTDVTGQDDTVTVTKENVKVLE